MTLTHSLRRPKSRAWHAFFIALAMAFLVSMYSKDLIKEKVVYV